jgi:cytochrome c-type biogenesis protein
VQYRPDVPRAPCLGPTLTVVLGLAATQGSAARTVLAAAYALGIGLPFYRRRRRPDPPGRDGAVRAPPHPWVSRIGGAMLVAVGIPLTSGAPTRFVNWLRATVGPGQIGI